VPQKIYTRYNCFDIKQTIVQISKTYASLNSPAMKFLFAVRRVNKNSDFSRCGRTKVFYCDFFDEAGFVSGYIDRYWDKTTP